MTTILERAKALVRGAVQGVGFRPFVYRLAAELNLCGWVLNSAQGVFLEVEGEGQNVRQFLLRLEKEKPPHAIIQSFEFSILDVVGYKNFEIRTSDDKGEKSALILPDLATCSECLREILDLANRRHRYPFTNCTHCGPRFTIIEELPYDRPHTSMRKFPMCPDCEKEYHDPLDRRFHAQPNACPVCGPQIELWNADGKILSRGEDALRETAAEIRAGRTVAMKGIGGFHLLADARNEAAVTELRVRKKREAKPFALMIQSLESAREICRLNDLEERLLLSPEAPIVLLPARPNPLAASIAPGNPYLGLMLPSTPLHHLLMRELGFPIVATSGNLSDEPICTDETEALARLRGIADFFLVHDRPIVRPVDDSVVRVMCGREMIVRRARGYAPLPLHLKEPMPCVLAVGAHLKNTIALSVGQNVFISQHIGDLETSQAHDTFRAVAADLPRLYDVRPELVACDLHPDYLSTKYAAQLGPTLIPVQHHWAHVLGCMAENEVESPALGVAWDGTGYGEDGTIWGGEFLRASPDSFQRVAHFRQFRLPGGEAAIKEPRRTALGLLFALKGEKALHPIPSPLTKIFSPEEISVLGQMLAKGLHSPVTSSAGRLFDAVASLIGLRQRANFEGQGAMELEFACRPGIEDAYRFDLQAGSPAVLDWQPVVEVIIGDLEKSVAPGVIAAKFHNAMAESIVAVAKRVGEAKVVLSGGCFQNRYLLERAVQRLIAAGFRPYWHQRVPTNDGGISLGQIMAARVEISRRGRDETVSAHV